MADVPSHFRSPRICCLIIRLDNPADIWSMAISYVYDPLIAFLGKLFFWESAAKKRNPNLTGGGFNINYDIAKITTYQIEISLFLPYAIEKNVPRHVLMACRALQSIRQKYEGCFWSVTSVAVHTHGWTGSAEILGAYASRRIKLASVSAEAPSTQNDRSHMTSVSRGDSSLLCAARSFIAMSKKLTRPKPQVTEMPRLGV